MDFADIDAARLVFGDPQDTDVYACRMSGFSGTPKIPPKSLIAGFGGDPQEYVFGDPQKYLFIYMLERKER